MSVIKSLYTAASEEYLYQQNIANKIIIPSSSGKDYIDGRLLGGFNKSDILLLAGLSGTGKSTEANEIGFNVCTLNEYCRTLCFSFEVPGRKLAAKLISKQIGVSLKEMYLNSPISQENYSSFRDIPYDIIETTMNIDVINKVIDQYCNKYHNERVHVIFDHSLLVKDRQGDNDMDTLRELANLINSIKQNYNIVFIVVSQLNNAMLDPKRLMYPGGHYPNQTDIFGSKYLYHVANNVICIIDPNKLNLPIKKYGTHQLPFTTTNKTYNYFYAHTIKARDGEIGIDPLINQLHHSYLKELSEQNRNLFKEKYGI